MRINYLAWFAFALLSFVSPTAESQLRKSHAIEWTKLRCLESRSKDLDLQKQEADATPNPLHLFVKRKEHTLVITEEDFSMTYTITHQSQQGLRAFRDRDPMPFGSDEIMIDGSGTKTLMVGTWMGGKFAHSFSGSAMLFSCERQ